MNNRREKIFDSTEKPGSFEPGPFQLTKPLLGLDVLLHFTTRSFFL